MCVVVVVVVMIRYRSIGKNEVISTVSYSSQVKSVLSICLADIQKLGDIP